MKVSVIGATGYTGLELVKILTRHKNCEITCLTSETYAGKKFSEVYPEMRSLCDIKLQPLDTDAVASACETAFLCLPHAASQEAVSELYTKGLKVIDLSADFRLNNKELYEKTYNTPHNHPELLLKAAYGLPEIFTEDVAAAGIIANPGCYPTSVITPLYPLLDAGVIDSDGIIADSKSGVSGAGRKAGLANSFCEVNEDFRPYGIFSHRHNPEINHILNISTEEHVDVLFTPHLLPVNRGIESTIYVKTSAKRDELTGILRKYYEGRKFVRILDAGVVPSLSNVTGTNFIDINVFVDKGRAVIVSVLDNLIKGASGMAVQNFNIMNNIDETEGLI